MESLRELLLNEIERNKIKKRNKMSVKDMYEKKSESFLLHFRMSLL